MDRRSKGYLVTYFSQTGSTRKVAEAIFDALPEPKELLPMEPSVDLTGYELAFVGFPIWDMEPASVAAEFLGNHCAACPVALFYTQGNQPDFWQDRAIDGRLRSICEGNVVDRFVCRGAIPESMIQMMETDPQTAQFATEARGTKDLPDGLALERARDFARGLASEF